MKHGLRLPFFYGWVIVASSFVLLGLAYTIMYSFSLFFVAILEEFGWSRALTAGVFSTFTLVSGLSGPLLGVLMDRRGPRWVVAGGLFVLIAGLVGASRLSQPWHFYLAFGLVTALGVTSTGWVPNVTLLANWFVRRLGTVVGIASAGIGFGMLLLVPLLQYYILRFGWRNAYVFLAVVALSIMLPTAVLFLRRRPQDMGLLPDGGTVAVADQALDADRLVVDRAWVDRVWTVRTALATRRFWFASGSTLLIGFASQMVLVHQVALLTDAGYDKLLAASVVGVVGISSVAGKLLWGTASDRVGREVAFSVGMGCGVVALILLALSRTAQVPWLPYLYGVWMGLGYAVWSPLGPTLAADLFRGKNFGSIFGLMNVGSSLGSAPGVWLAGYVYDRTGDYLPALALGLVALFGSCACLWLAAPRHVRLVPGQAKRRLQVQPGSR